MSFGWVELLMLSLLMAWVTGCLAWERWRVKQIHDEFDDARAQTKQIFANLRKYVGEAHER